MKKHYRVNITYQDGTEQSYIRDTKDVMAIFRHFGEDLLCAIKSFHIEEIN